MTTCPMMHLAGAHSALRVGLHIDLSLTTTSRFSGEGLFFTWRQIFAFKSPETISTIPQEKEDVSRPWVWGGGGGGEVGDGSCCGPPDLHLELKVQLHLSAQVRVDLRVQQGLMGTGGDGRACWF